MAAPVAPAPVAAQPMQGGPMQGGPMMAGPMPDGPMSGQMSAAPMGMYPSMEQEADDGWGKIGLVMVVLTLVFAGGVAYFIASGDDAEVETAAAAKVEEGDEAQAAEAVEADVPEVADEAEPAAEEPAAVDEVDEEEGTGSVAGDLVAAGGAEIVDESDDADEADGDDEAADDTLLRENGEIDRPGGLVSLSIESQPEGAQVIRKRDGVRLGVTPYRYEVEPSAGSISFVLKHEGYKSIVVKMPANQDGVRQVMLLPGKGGVAVPEPTAAPADETPSKARTPKKRTVKKAPARKKATKKRAKKRAAPKKKRGTVDYAADPIPL